MMKSRFIFAMVIIFVLLLSASAALAAKPVIKADNTYFDFNTGLYILRGNVYVEVKNRIITAEEAKVNLASMEVWGSGGISVTQDDLRFTGESVYVYGSRDIAQIDGGVNLTRSGLAITADTVEYNWRSKIAVFRGRVRINQAGSVWTADSVTYHVIKNTFL